MKDVARILIVEDSDLDFACVERSLQQDCGGNVRVIRADHPQAALQRIQDERPDALVVDFHLGTGSGCELIQAARAEGYAGPIVVLTAANDASTRRASETAGADELLVKGTSAARQLGSVIRHLTSRCEEREEAGLMRAALAASPVATMLIRQDEDEASPRIVFANRACEALFHLKEEALKGRSLLELVAARPPSARSGGHGPVEAVCRRGDGTEFPGEASFAPLATGPKQSGCKVLVIRDVTEQKQLESRCRLRNQMLEQADVAILSTDLAGRVIYCNQAAERVHGFTRQRVLGRSLSELFPHAGDFIRAARKGTFSAGFWSGELELDVNGSDLHLRSLWTQMREEDGTPAAILIVNHDLTELRELHEQMARTQRLEAIGSLAAGVAHDLNNILAPIIMGASLFDLYPDLPEPFRELRGTIESSAQRGAKIVQQLLSFSRGGEAEQVVVQIRHLAKEVMGMAEETFPKNISIRREFAADLAPVQANPTEIHQILLNLFVNARDAMPDGGVLTVGGANVTLSTEEAREIPGASPGEWVTVFVADTGTGIPAELREKIFELLFTTKPQGRGTGLGLTTVSRIIAGQNGFLHLDSDIGKGSRFTVYLPPVRAEVTGDAETKAEAVAGEGTGETVLVVDDEPHIRLLMSKLLQHHGYETLCAENGRVGLEEFARHEGKIGLVISDILMPEMDGSTMVRKMRQQKPELKVIFCSGADSRDGSDELDEAVVQLGAATVLEKPFNTATLLRRIREVVDGATTSTG